MTVRELATLIDAQIQTPTVALDAQVTIGYTCDLLSWVMAHGDAGMAWVTVQTHMNVVAVAVLLEMACVIMPENIQMEEQSLLKASAESMPVLKSSLSAYEICGRMAKAGIPARA